MIAALILALLLTPALWFTRARKPIAFLLVAFVVAWFQMAITKGAGGSVHHVVLLWPIPHMFLAIAFAEASQTWRPGPVRRICQGLLVVAMLYLAAENLLVTNQYFYQLARYGPSSIWTDAIYQLSRSIGELKPSKVVIADWGMLNPLVLLHRGQLPLESFSDQFLSQALSKEKWNRDRAQLEEGLWVGHTVACEVFRGTNDRIVKAAGAAGFRKEMIREISDRHGRPVFEMYRFVHMK